MAAVADDHDQQFCLRWNNFQANITSQFETLRDDEDFVDVTLACEGQRLEAHKVVLSACSPFFKELFKSNPCPHPIIFMRDVEARHVAALLEFMYAGEVNVAQAHLSGFLKTAESLQIRGLTDASRCHKNKLYHEEPQPSSPVSQLPNTSNTSTQNGTKSSNRTRISPSRTVSSSQDKQKPPDSPPPSKRHCKTEERDRLDTSINPFALPGARGLHSEIDLNTDLIEPKVELPDYASDDENGYQEGGQNFLDINESFHKTLISGNAEIKAGTSGVHIPEISQESPQGVKPRTRRRGDQWVPLPLTLDMAGAPAATGEAYSRYRGWRERRDGGGRHSGRVVKLGEGVEICEEQLRSVKWSDYRKLTRGLATILFSPVELATCSVTGQRWSRAGSGERPVKPALDRAKVQAIISYVATRFPMVEISRIKQVLAYKCKENSTALKMKAIRYFGDQQIQSPNNNSNNNNQ